MLVDPFGPSVVGFTYEKDEPKRHDIDEAIARQPIRLLALIGQANHNAYSNSHFLNDRTPSAS